MPACLHENAFTTTDSRFFIELNMCCIMLDRAPSNNRLAIWRLLRHALKILRLCCIMLALHSNVQKDAVSFACAQAAFHILACLYSSANSLDNLTHQINRQHCLLALDCCPAEEISGHHNCSHCCLGLARCKIG